MDGTEAHSEQLTQTDDAALDALTQPHPPAEVGDNDSLFIESDALSARFELNP